MATARSVTEKSFVAITDVTTTGQTIALDGLLHQNPLFKHSVSNDYTYSFASGAFKDGASLVLAITKTVSGNVTPTLSAANYTHFVFAGGVALAGNTLPVLSQLSGNKAFYTGLVFGTTIYWTDSLSAAALITSVNSEFTVTGNQLTLALLAVTTSKIADAAVTYAKMLGQSGAGEKVMVTSNSGVVSSPYATQSNDPTSGVKTLLEATGSWTAGVKTVSGILAGQQYYSATTGYFYNCYVDGTAVRTLISDTQPAESSGLIVLSLDATTDQTIIPGTRYFAASASLRIFTLPASPSQNDRFAVQGRGTGGWKIAQNALQSIHKSGSTTTVGTGGSLASAAQWDSVTLVCTVAGTSAEWAVESFSGTLTIV